MEYSIPMCLFESHVTFFVLYALHPCYTCHVAGGPCATMLTYSVLAIILQFVKPVNLFYRLLVESFMCVSRQTCDCIQQGEVLLSGIKTLNGEALVLL